MDDDEDCDDGNAQGCGTCSADCQVAVVPAAATGSITAIPASSHLDGEVLTLNDGLHSAVIFEFDCNFPAAVIGGHERIDLYSNASAQEVATAIATAINAVGTELGIAATALDNVVGLSNDQ